MNDVFKVGLQGEVTILRNGKLVYRERNTITVDAKEVMLNCLALPTSGNSIDGIRFIGDFTTVLKPISNRVVDLGDGSVTYTATAYEGDFNGTISDLNLNMGTINKNLAVKTGLSILKNDMAEIEVNWKIKLNIT